jgi:dihydrodipicolinate synthase
MSIFTGAGVALVTPFYPDGSVNFEKLRELIEWQIDSDTDAIIVCGTTGESAALSESEHTAVIKAAVEFTAGRVPVVAGAGSNDTAFCVRLSKEAENVGADALLSVTPYYNKTSQRGLIAHYTAQADAVNIPIIVYNVPSRTGVNILPETMKTLALHKNIVATKEASGDFSQIAEIAALCGNDIDIYSGNDDHTVPIMSLGGKGVISVFSNILPKKMHDITEYCLDGKFDKACDLQLKYLRLMNALFMDVNPIPVKMAMNILGLEVGPLRMPLIEMDDAKKAQLTAMLEEYKLI